MALKELEVRYATKRAKDYKLTDGEGLYLLVRANGSKLWRMKYRYGGKEKLFEPRRVCRRPQLLRGMGYDEQDDQQVFG